MADLIKLGDVATCHMCGAKSAPAYTTAPHLYRPASDPLMVTWVHGVRPSTVSVYCVPKTCTWCQDQARGAPPSRPETAFETFERLARIFHEQTGIWPPGYGEGGQQTDDGGERGRRWDAFLKERARGSRPPPPPPKPKGQLALF